MQADAPDQPDPPETAGRDQGGRFLPGRSGNPAGRPPGAKHEALKALDAIGEEGAQRVLRKVLAMAEAGDMRAAEILLRRLWPERKGRVVPFELPAMETAADAVRAAGAVAQAVAAGELTPEEGQAVAAIVEAHRRTIETADHARRLEAVEERLKRAEGAGDDGGM